MAVSLSRQCLTHLAITERRLLTLGCCPWYAGSSVFGRDDFKCNSACLSGNLSTHARRLFANGKSNETPQEERDSSESWVDVSAEYDPEPKDVLSRDTGQKGQTYAPFIPPSVDKLIRIIMRHGKKDIARKIVFDTSHALYNMTRKANPRPQLRQRNPKFVK